MSPLVELLQAVTECSTLAHQSLREICPKLNMGDSTYSAWFKHDWLVKRELLAFMLQVVDRTAFTLTGVERRSNLLDFAGPAAAILLVDSYDFVDAPPDFDKEGWKGQAHSDCLMVFNDAAIDYGGCELFLYEQSGSFLFYEPGSPLAVSKLGPFAEDANVFGKMTGRNRQCGWRGRRSQSANQDRHDGFGIVNSKHLLTRVKKACV